MKVQKFEGLPVVKQTFKSYPNTKNNNNKIIFDMDSAEGAAATDSIESPFFPQLIKKIQKSFNIVFPKKIVREAANIDAEINNIVEKHNFYAVA